jgi:hypothetical protein
VIARTLARETRFLTSSHTFVDVPPYINELLSNEVFFTRAKNI